MFRGWARDWSSDLGLQPDPSAPGPQSIIKSLKHDIQASRSPSYRHLARPTAQAARTRNYHRKRLQISKRSSIRLQGVVSYHMMLMASDISHML